MTYLLSMKYCLFNDGVLVMVYEITPNNWVGFLSLFIYLHLRDRNQPFHVGKKTLIKFGHDFCQFSFGVYSFPAWQSIRESRYVLSFSHAVLTYDCLFGPDFCQIFFGCFSSLL